MMTDALPTWLSAPDPETPVTSENKAVTRELLLAQYENIFMRVITEVAHGQPLHLVLKNDSRSIDYNDFYRWIKRDPERYSLFQEAQELRTEFHAGEIIQIADAEDSAEDVNRSKLRIETRKWLMGVHNKKRYGETKQIELNTSISITDALAQANARLIEGEILSIDSVNSSQLSWQDSEDQPD